MIERARDIRRWRDIGRERGTEIGRERRDVGREWRDIER